jgi:antitoxin component of RelBE/YafQ-DinJ toxin-antitoxin module
MPETDSVRARSGRGHKERAAAALANMGLPLSDAIRLLKLGAGERRLPSDGGVPKPGTRQARAERVSSQDKAFAAFTDSLANLCNNSD